MRRQIHGCLNEDPRPKITDGARIPLPCENSGQCLFLDTTPLTCNHCSSMQTKVKSSYAFKRWTCRTATQFTIQ